MLSPHYQDPETKDTLLMHACKFDNKDIANFLIECVGCDPNYVNTKNGNTPLL